MNNTVKVNKNLNELIEEYLGELQEIVDNLSPLSLKYLFNDKPKNFSDTDLRKFILKDGVGKTKKALLKVKGIKALTPKEEGILDRYIAIFNKYANAVDGIFIAFVNDLAGVMHNVSACNTLLDEVQNISDIQDDLRVSGDVFCEIHEQLVKAIPDKKPEYSIEKNSVTRKKINASVKVHYGDGNYYIQFLTVDPKTLYLVNNGVVKTYTDTAECVKDYVRLFNR